jgi:maltooligosyltrehalose trehalohydrolase
MAYARKFPIGAEVAPHSGGVHFRVWAPNCAKPYLLLGHSSDLTGPDVKQLELEPEDHGYWCLHVPHAREGMFYKYKLDSGAFPDPASRFQPEGPHGASQIVDSEEFQWTDSGWRGVPHERQVIYEMHIGTFTPEGTWVSAMKQLPELAGFGVTVLEVMPVAEFPGRFGWGYDGVDLFAPTRLYGSPDDFRAFVNRAHQLGMAVILDVVYNHLGPDGNYLKEFAEHYFTDRHKNEWGQAINFDDQDSGPVREFFATNAAYWIDEFHLDGLRLDATQQIYDCSEEHILTHIARSVRQAAKGRVTFIVAENECQHGRLVRSPDKGGHDLDAIWNEDFHHTALVAATGRSEAYFSDYTGSPQELISAVKRGFLYQGQFYSWQDKHRGTPAFDLHPNQVVNFLQNHDQVANSLRGLRLHQLTSPGRARALTALLLLGPEIPMLFQGQEFAASAPFLYFAEHNPELARLVSKGRKEFLSQFGTIASAEASALLTDPAKKETFLRCKLDLSEREKHAAVYMLHRDLLKLRREDPVFSNARRGAVDGAVLGPEAFVLRFFGDDNNDRLLLINLGADLKLKSIADPLLAPLERCDWELLWSSERPCYFGSGDLPFEHPETHKLLLPGHAALVLGAVPRETLRHGETDPSNRACDCAP